MAETGYPLQGQCVCGMVRYQMQAPPMFVHCCHCRSCQRETGTAFALNALIEADQLTCLSGQPEKVSVQTDSGRGQDIFRCPRCRTAVWSHYLAMGKSVCFVRVGTLDEPDSLQPDIHIFTRSKQPWVSIPPGQAAVDAYYDHTRYWPAASLSRLRAALGLA